MKISRGIIPTAKKVVVYGPEGIGKSTFASKFPGAVFLDTEGSTSHMDVARFDAPQTWKDLAATVMWCKAHPAELGTLVIDTMDWAEALAFRAVCEEKEVKSIEDIPYGKGYVFAQDKIRKLLDELSGLIAQGVNVVITAHAQVKKFEQPDEMGSYDRYGLKLNEKNIAPLVKEWGDLLLFANYKTNVVTAPDGKTKKATGGKKRVMYTTHAAAWDAKNRFGLPDELPFEFEAIAELFPQAEKRETSPSAPAGHLPTEDGATKEAAPEPVSEEFKARMTGKTKKAKEEKPSTARPESMTSDDPEKDKALKALWSRMVAAQLLDPMVLRVVVAEKGYYDLDIQPREYDTEFINDVLLEAWGAVCDLMLTKENDLPF